MRQGDLNMKRHGYYVRDQDESDTYRPGGQCAPYQAVAEPKPITGDESHLGWAHPRRDSTSALGCREEVMDGEDVEVESSDSHYWIVGVLLVLDGEVGKCVPNKSEVVIGRMKRLDEGWTRGEERTILDVWVVLLGGC